MKKKRTFLMLLLLIFVMCGCKQNDFPVVVYDDYFRYELNPLVLEYKAYTKTGDKKSTSVINIPESVNSLPVTYASLDVDNNIEYINISRNINVINMAGDFSNVKSINVDENNPNYVTVDGNLYTKDQKTLAAYAGAKTEKYFDVPEGVTSISNTAFSRCNNLIAIAFPNTIKNLSSQGIIPTAVISNCENIRKVYIPKGIERFGAFVHYNPGENEDLILYFEDDYTNIKSVYNWWPKEKVKYNVTKEDFYLKDDIEYFLDSKTNEMSLIANYSNLKMIEIEENVNINNETSQVEVISIGAFSGCSELTEIKLPSSIKKIDDNAFVNCNNLETVYYNGTIEDWCNIKFGNEYSNPMSYAKHFYIKDSNNDYYEVTEIEIEIPNTVISVDYQFYGFDNITTIVIPSSVTSIGKYAFARCRSLESITLPFIGNTLDGTTNTHFGYIFGASSYLDNSSYVPTSLKAITITGETSIGESAFSGCSSLTSLTIPEGVISIGESAFSGCSSLTSLTIPESVTSIGESAFSGCSSLTSLTIPEGVISIGESSFSGCSSLTSLTIPESVTSIGESAFSGCSSLISLTIPESVTSIGESAFSGCSSLTSLTIPESVTSIGESAFSGCSSLEKTFYKGTIEEWCNIKFNDEMSNPMSYAKKIFMINSNNNYYVVTEIKIPNTITSIDYQFYSFENIVKITIPSSIESIGEDAFYGCSSLENVHYKGTLEEWCNIKFSNGVSNPMYYAKHFYMLKSNNSYYEVTEVEIPNTITSIGEYQFYGFDNLKKITIPSNVTNVGYRAFVGCYSLTIYCEESSQPDGWDSRWNYSNNPVVWGYKN